MFNCYYKLLSERKLFSQRLEKNLEGLGLQLLEKTNIAIDVDDFDPGKSEVTLEVKKSESWTTVTKIKRVSNRSTDVYGKGISEIVYTQHKIIKLP